MTYNVNEAKTQLSSLLEAVQRGEEVTIARYGKPIAKLVALEPPQKRELGFHPVAMTDRKSTRLNSSHLDLSRMPSSA